MRRFVVLTALAASLLAATAAPVGASGTHQEALGCEWTEAAGTFSSLAQLGNSRTSTIERRTEPALKESADVDWAAQAKADAQKVKASFRVTIPVYFHVLRAGPTFAQGDVPQSMIDDQISVLNTTFGGQRGGANSGFEFVLAGVTRTTNAAWFAMEPGTPTEFEAKSALHQGGPNALNLYSTNGGNDFFLGWAYFPEDGAGNPSIDGIVVHWGSLPGSFINFFNLGFTATHEAGHWLGLWHTFDFACVHHGDFVNDTPQMSVPTSGCPEGKDTCPQPGLDPIHNYMDYSVDPCYTEFTTGQAFRMQKQYKHFRS
jgi:Pregnancy-associated plasma protein-A